MSTMRQYLTFLASHHRLLGFGVLTAMLSGFGQTFYIGLFNPQLRESFALGHSELGLLYGGATLLSAALLAWLGGLYDRCDPRWFVSATVVLLMLGCLSLGAAVNSISLFIALCALRLGGQGLMSHIALTTIALRFNRSRGKAVAITAMGFPLAEASFPIVAVAAMAWLEWSRVWWGSAALLAACLPLLLWLLGGAAELTGVNDMRGGQVAREFSRREVLRDWRFALLIPAAATPGFIVTIAFFYQLPLTAPKGWSTELVASGLALYALGHMLGLMSAGPLVDRFSGTRMLVPALLPLLGSMLLLTLFEARWAALVWPAMLGLGQGLIATALTALLAERYGLIHLGAIRATLQAFMVVSTALGPPLVGALLDAGASPVALTASLAGSVLMAISLAQIALSLGAETR